MSVFSNAQSKPIGQRMGQRAQYIFYWLIVKFLGLLPRSLARFICGNLTLIVSFFLQKKRPFQTAHKTLKIAFPEWTEEQRMKVLRKSIKHIGWMIAEIAHFPKYDRKKIAEFVVLEGLENYTSALARNKGVILFSGHFSAFELLPFAVNLSSGYNCHYLVRSIKNPLCDNFVNRYRSLHGNIPIDKNDAAKKILRILNERGTVGITIDQNSILREGVFVNFFNKPACTSTGLARVALKTGALVVPCFIFWDESLKKYRIRFDPAIPLTHTGNKSVDLQENTARFTQLIEHYVRCYPDQWTRWATDRWKTRPPEQPLSALKHN